MRRLLGRLLTAGLAAQQLERGDSIMLFEETAPVGTDTTFHLHRDSDEVGYVLIGETTFKIDEEVTVGGPGTCAFMPAARRMPGRTPTPKPAVCCSFIPGRGRRVFREAVGRPTGSINGGEANEIGRRHGWQIVGPPPF